MEDSEQLKSRANAESLLRLPPALLGRLWPPERAVLGVSVCRFLRQELLCNMNDVVIVGKQCGGMQHEICSGLQRLRGRNVFLRWHCKPAQTILQVKDLAEGVHSLGGSLSELNVQKCGIKQHAATLLAEALTECGGLSHLNVSQNRLSESGAERLFSSLQACTSLEHLDVSCCGIGPRASAALASALRSCHKLSRLKLSENYLQDEGASHVADALQSCSGACACSMQSRQY